MKNRTKQRANRRLKNKAELLGTPGEYDAIISSLHGVIFKGPMGSDAPEEGWQTADECAAPAFASLFCGV